MVKRLSHIDEQNNPRMVDVGHKPASHRVARAEARVQLPFEIMELLVDGELVFAKGPVFQTAKIAGIQGAKKTSELIPMCHPLIIDHIAVDIILEANEARIVCEVKCSGKTGVEMEALTGASVAALTIYDMCKALSHNIIVKNVRLISKTGGKKDFNRE
jgi:cyclic pyranopterin monophosphate synthase